MKFRLKDHPSFFAFLFSLVLLGGSFALAYRYQWKIYAVVPIFLAGAAVIILGYSFVKDILDFEKQKDKQDKDGKD